MIAGCTEHARSELFPDTAQRVSEITYVKDKRTNLCFAHNSVNNGHGFAYDVFVNVPCTPEVESLIK